jgi:hypothetical protein
MEDSTIEKIQYHMFATRREIMQNGYLVACMWRDDEWRYAHPQGWSLTARSRTPDTWTRYWVPWNDWWSDWGQVGSEEDAAYYAVEKGWGELRNGLLLREELWLRISDASTGIGW